MRKPLYVFWLGTDEHKIKTIALRRLGSILYSATGVGWFSFNNYTGGLDLTSVFLYSEDLSKMQEDTYTKTVKYTHDAYGTDVPVIDLTQYPILYDETIEPELFEYLVNKLKDSYD